MTCDAEHVELRIVDIGRGFDLKSFSADHMGLRNMRERAAVIFFDQRYRRRVKFTALGALDSQQVMTLGRNAGNGVGTLR